VLRKYYAHTRDDSLVALSHSQCFDDASGCRMSFVPWLLFVEATVRGCFLVNPILFRVGHAATPGNLPRWT
jgi:hypothetical protein